jgi:thioredoxin reductase
MATFATIDYQQKRKQVKERYIVEVMQENTVIIGAGPYGLAATTYLKARKIPTQTFGKPMEFWKKMPPGMFMKSTWGSLNIADPKHTYTLDKYSKRYHTHKEDPVSLKTFLAYSQWYMEQANIAQDIDQTFVTGLHRDGQGFQVDLEDGRSVKASRVLVATGVALFPCIPAFARDLPTTRVTHSQDYSDFSDFKGKKVVVVGRGQSAFESAVLLFEAGAEVEVISRGPVIWINRRLYRYTGFAKRLFYPPSDIGPAGLSWIVAFPQLYRRFSENARTALDTRSVRPAAAPWIRPSVEGRFQVTPNTQIVEATEQNDVLNLKLSNDESRQVDHIVLGTGYEPNIEKLHYIDPALRQQIQQVCGYPALNKWFESSVPHLYFSGALAAYNFGPICRFVTGSFGPAHQLARHAARGI